ncbi:MAG: hypothetical protein AMS15_02535 [Planctomycetes bacterium DG_23]|nr:MAG: hypothetical protein AMS15_02535 [Planctomycetes bacterium DG_23]
MVKRVLLGAIVVVVAVIFVVVLRRVSQPLPTPPPPPPERRQTVLQGLYTGYDPDTNEKSFQVTWESARRRADKKIEVASPRIVFFRPSGREITITAQEGIFEEKTYDGKLMGKIVMETDDGTRATTGEIQWYRDQASDEKYVASTFPVTVENDMVQVTGTGLRTEDDLNKIIVSQDGKVMVKKGLEGLFPSEEGRETEQPEQQTPSLFVTCAGPLTLDRPGRLITFSDNVNLRQEEGLLTADILEVFYSPVAEEKDPDQVEAEIEKIKATGNVHWEDGKRSASCQNLVYQPTEKVLHIQGSPLILKDAGDELETEEVFLEQEKGKFSAPAGGRLTLARKGGFLPGREEAGSGRNQSYEVFWDGDWLYDTRTREVSFKENVRLLSEKVNLSSQALRVAFKENSDEEGKEEKQEEEEAERPLEVRATGEVMVVTVEPEGTLRGDEFIYDSKKKLSTIRGNPAEFTWPSDVSTPEGKKKNILHALAIHFETEGGNAHAEGPGDLVFYTRQEFTPRVPSPGETAAPTEKEIPSQVKISWKEKATFKDNFNHLAFFKDVEIVRGTMIIKAQKFVISLKEAEEGEKELSQATAREEVLVKDEDFEVRGNSLLREENTAVIEGAPLAEARFDTSMIRSQTIQWDEKNQLLKAEAGQFITLRDRKGDEEKHLPPEVTDVRWKGQMLYDQAKGEALFNKDTELISPEGTIKADTLKMIFERENNALLWLMAEGNVLVEGKERKARCHKLFWDAIGRIATLTGAPEVEVWQGDNRTLWRKATYYADQDYLKLEGGVLVSTTPE